MGLELDISLCLTVRSFRQLLAHVTDKTYVKLVVISVRYTKLNKPRVLEATRICCYRSGSVEGCAPFVYSMSSVDARKYLYLSFTA